MNTRNALIAIFLCLVALGSTVFASGEAGEEIEQPEGPHGGKLLVDDRGLALEIAIFEQGAPPEMRIYPYRNGEPLAAGELEVTVSLERLGGTTDQLRFNAEQGYLVSDSEIREPHSFDVTVNARVGGQSYQWQYDNHDGRTEISERQQQIAGVTTERAGPAVLTINDTLFGVVAPQQDQVYRINAPYPGLVDHVYVAVGDKVSKGQKLATLRNTQTLQTYQVDSPVEGEVTARYVNTGDRADQGPLLEITNLAEVWVELSAFPENIEKLKLGQRVTVYDLHQHEKVESTISYIAPAMTGGHIARARATIPNPDGHWRPGMHLKADVEVEKREVPLAIRNSALQTFREMPVVFARYGNVFEVRMVELGATSAEYSEVLGGLDAGTEYVTGNSYLIKADVLKDGASHDH